MVLSGIIVCRASNDYTRRQTSDSTFCNSDPILICVHNGPRALKSHHRQQGTSHTAVSNRASSPSQMAPTSCPQYSRRHLGSAHPVQRSSTSSCSDYRGRDRLSFRSNELRMTKSSMRINVCERGHLSRPCLANVELRRKPIDLSFHVVTHIIEITLVPG